MIRRFCVRRWTFVHADGTGQQRRAGTERRARRGYRSLSEASHTVDV